MTPFRAGAVEAWATCALFVVGLLLWGGLSLVRDPGPISKSENRFLAQMPDGAESLGTYVRGLDAYLEDHVAWRDTMISLYSRVKVGVLGASPSPKLLVGQDEWFYLNDTVAVDQYRGLATLTSDELERWKVVLEERRDWLAERGAAFVLVLVPNKHQVYSEFMPARITRVGDDEQHAQLARYLAEHSSLNVVDLMPDLLAAKKHERVFQKTDTHWNDVGAYLGYERILTAAGVELPEYKDRLVPVPVTLERYVDRGIGLTSMAGLSDVYRENVLKLRIVEPQSKFLGGGKKPYATLEREQRPLAHGVPGAPLPRAVVFRDSFSNALIPYLSENFRRVLYVWARDVEGKYVEREKPDIVIQEIAGRLLGREPQGIR
ncbi:MAG: alginate O-acetyltransferase complex protein AlgJ [Myxococcota bacterium]|jgi:alginate O-acetyltransferase complex protein AlgJ